MATAGADCDDLDWTCAGGSLLGIETYGEPEEVAHAILGLVLPAASYVNGAVLAVDGEGAGNVVGFAAIDPTLNGQRTAFLFVPFTMLPEDVGSTVLANLMAWYGL